MYYTKFNVEYQENSKKISVTPHWIEVRIVDRTESMRILINRCWSKGWGVISDALIATGREIKSGLNFKKG